MSAGDFPILGPPSISLQKFTDILTAAKSPAAPDAVGMYTAALRYHVDPAVLLAVFQHESSFGRAGVAVQTRNVGNLEFTPISTEFGAVKAGRWAAYPSWTASAEDTARLLASSLYGRNPAFNTVRKFPYRWAPSSDGNNPAEYGAALASSIASWTGSSGRLYSVSPQKASATAPSGPKRTGPPPSSATIGLQPKSDTSSAPSSVPVTIGPYLQASPSGMPQDVGPLLAILAFSAIAVVLLLVLVA